MTQKQALEEPSDDLEGADGAVFNGESVFKSTYESNDEGGD